MHHSDRDSQYTSIRYTDRLADAAGALPSVGSRRNSYDNALAESTTGQIKTEPVHWRALEELEFALFEYLDGWSHRRLRSEIDLVTPAEKEATFYAQPVTSPEAR